MPTENNSEKKLTVMGVVMGILTILAPALDALLGTGMIPSDHVAYLVLTGILAIVAPIVGYTVSRGLLKGARVRAEADVASSDAYARAQIARDELNAKEAPTPKS